MWGEPMILRIAWYSHPTLIAPLTFLVGAPRDTRMVSHPIQSIDLLELALCVLKDPDGNTVPEIGDLFTLADQAYRYDRTGWTPVTLHHLHTTPLTSGRPLAYGISPLAPRGSYSLTDHQAIARTFARWIWTQGLLPVLLHLYLPSFLDDTSETERTLALRLGHTWLVQSAILLRLDFPPSAGMAAELALAHRYQRPVELVPWEALGLAGPYDLTTSH